MRPLFRLLRLRDRQQGTKPRIWAVPGGSAGVPPDL